jgi:ABC-type proline/glycine betaine transport system permease subunit
VGVGFVVVPSLIVSAVVIAALRAGMRRVEFAYLLTNVLLFVVFLGKWSYDDGYTSVARVTTGVVLASVVCLPWLRDTGRDARRMLTLSFAIWLSMLPVVAVYGFGG